MKLIVLYLVAGVYFGWSYNSDPRWKRLLLIVAWLPWITVWMVKETIKWWRAEGYHYPVREIEQSSDLPTPGDLKQEALRLLRLDAEARGDTHFADHLIEFTNNGWTVQHPIPERLSGDIFFCPFAFWDAGDIGYRGRYVLYMDEDGQLNIAEEVT